MLGHRDTRHRIAELYAERRKFGQAVAAYRAIVAQNSDDLEALRKLGDAHVAARDYSEAAQVFAELARRYRAQGSALTAMATLGRAAKIAQKDERNAASLMNELDSELAGLRQEVKRVREALGDYDDAARTLEQNGRFEDAVTLLQRMATVDSGNPLPYVRLAECLCRLEQVDSAVSAFRTAVWCLVRLRRFADAARVVERLLHFKKSPEDAYLAAWTHVENGEKQSGHFAIAHLQTCFEAAPDDLDVLILLSRAFTLANHGDKALEVLKGTAVVASEQNDVALRAELLDYLASVAPNDPQVVQLLAEPTKAEDNSASLAAYRDTMASITAEASSVDGLTGSAPIEGDELSEVSVLSGVWVEAVVPPGVARALSEADTFLRLRLYSKARYVLETALAQEGRRSELQEKLRMVLLSMGDTRNAIEHSIAMARQYLDRGYTARARALVSEVLGLDPGCGAALSLMSVLEQAEKNNLQSG